MSTAQLKSAEEAAGKIGRKIRILNAENAGEIDAVFAIVDQERIGALIVAPTRCSTFIANGS